MKRIATSMIPLAIVLVVGCKKKDSEANPRDCTALEVNAAQAALVQSDKLDQPSCDNYKKAIRELKSNCSASLSASRNEFLDEELAKPCPN